MTNTASKQANSPTRPFKRSVCLVLRGTGMGTEASSLQIYCLCSKRLSPKHSPNTRKPEQLLKLDEVRPFPPSRTAERGDFHQVITSATNNKTVAIPGVMGKTLTKGSDNLIVTPDRGWREEKVTFS